MVSLKALIFALALAGCGDTVNNYYTSGDDSATEETPSGNSSENACGDSPLTGRQLWETADCRVGSVDPFGEECTAHLAVSNSDDCYVDGLEVTHYEGLTLEFEPCQYGPFGFHVLSLRRPSAQELPSFADCVSIGQERELGSSYAYNEAMWENKVARILCYQERSSDVYAGFMLEPGQTEPSFCDGTVWWVNDFPWKPSRFNTDDDCNSIRKEQPWYHDCNTEHPDPDPCDYEGQCTE